MKNKNIIVSAILILLIIIGVGFRYMANNHPDKLINTTDSVQFKNVIFSNESHSADVVVSEPVNPSRLGVIEIGSKGFNMFIVDVDRQGNWKLIVKEFGKSLAYEGFLTTEDVKSGLKNYLSTMTDKGVAGKHCHFVVSSGALKNPKTELIMNAISKMGYVVNKVTPEQEGTYALYSSLPKEYENRGFVVDIGGGNTKISWKTSSGIKSLEGPGAKYVQNGKTDEQVAQTIKSLVNQVPESAREYCFILGGVPMNLAKLNETPRFQLLQNASNYSFPKDDVYLNSGLNIYSAIQEVSPTSKYVFDWDTNFSIGFLINLISKK